MILRPRQETFVERSLAALREHKNTLGVAATGAGKTIILSAVAGKWLEGTQAKACVVSHRDEIHKQNAKKYLRVNPKSIIGSCDSKNKSWKSQTTFAMIQTLEREKNLIQMPALDLLVIDEAHHCVANSYRKVIDYAKEKNPDIAIYGVTATPGRSDSKNLRDVFDNVADQIRIGELVKSGHLVPPVTFAIDVGVRDKLSGVDEVGDEFDMSAVAEIMDRNVVNESVVKHWKEKAGDRKTIVFCSTIAHAGNACTAFLNAGINAAVISGDTRESERIKLLHEFDKGDLQVLLNCFVLTEGYDSQPVSCVVLLRPSSQKSTFIQCVGRGLRTVDPEEYPGIVKKDCIVLDFGTSAIVHGSLELDIDLEVPEEKGKTKRKGHVCPSCEASLPPSSTECLICGAILDIDTAANQTTKTKSSDALEDFVMSEIDLLAKSSFQWSDLHDDGGAFLATGFDAWSGNFFLEGCWYAVGGKKKTAAKLLAAGDRTICFAAADDWLNCYESADGAQKSKRWLSESATAAQLQYIPEYKSDFGLTRYKASCLLAFKFNKQAVHNAIFNAPKSELLAGAV